VTPQNGLVERMREVALDKTLQVEAGATIGVHPEAAAKTVSASSDGIAETVSAAANADKTASSAETTAAAHTLPRISLGPIGGAGLSASVGATPPDLRFVKVIGEGGMGRVHLANQNSLRREVAVKTLKDDANSHAHDALLSEARVTGYLSHPGIIPVHSLGLDDDDRPVLVMKRIEGVPWSDLLANPENEAWSHWDSRTGDRLEVHLNVMLGLFGEVYLVDWGLARSIDSDEANHLVGTPAYMAPEMALGEKVDARTDVYLLGATLHEILTGEYLHAGKTLHELLDHAATSARMSYDEDVPEELAALCSAATAKEPTARPASAEAFRLALASYLSHRSSIEVSNAALERLEAAEVTRSDMALGAQERAYHLGSHCAEARFGFQEALRAWPENVAAERGLQRSLALLVDAHLLRRDAVGAKAQLKSISDPPDDLLPKIAELERDLAREGSERERLEHLDRELDSNTGFKARLATFLLFAVTTSAVSVVLIATGKGDSITNAESVFAISGLLVASAFILIYKREKLFSNAFNKRLVACAFTSMLGIFLNRLVGWQLATPIPHVLVGDLLLLSACTTLSGYIVTRWILWMTPFLLVGAVIITLVPSAPAPTVFASIVFLSLVGGGFAWLAQARRAMAK
jgi:serine/threonine-protein kinase